MKCFICGMIKKVMMECTRCGRKICLNDMDVKNGLCADCQVMFYVEKYREKIESYCLT